MPIRPGGMGRPKKPLRPKAPKKVKFPKMPRGGKGFPFPKGVKGKPARPGKKPGVKPNPKPKPPPIKRPVAPAGAQAPPKGKPANNTTCDVYIDPNAPAAAPDTAGVSICLQADFRQGSEASEGSQTWRWTHLMFCVDTVDVRDGWPSGTANRVYVPDKNGTRFDVVFVERVNRGTPQSYLRVFLKRNTPTWPTAQL
jgi:hypothetical protein